MSTKIYSDSLTLAAALEKLAHLGNFPALTELFIAAGTEEDRLLVDHALRMAIDLSNPMTMDVRRAMIELILNPELSEAILLRASNSLIIAGDGHYVLCRLFGYPDKPQYLSRIGSLSDSARLGIIELFGVHNDGGSLSMLLDTDASDVVKIYAIETLARLKTTRHVTLGGLSTNQLSAPVRAAIVIAVEKEEIRGSIDFKEAKNIALAAMRRNQDGNGNSNRPSTLHAAHHLVGTDARARIRIRA